MADTETATIEVAADIAPLRQALAEAKQETTDTASELATILGDQGGSAFDLLSTAARKSAATIEKTLVAAIEGSSIDWNKTITGMISQLGTLAIQSSVINPLSSLLGLSSSSSSSSASNSSSSSSSLLGSLGSLITDTVGALFGGAKAAGGTVAEDRPYLVGEQGPEVFVPAESGHIVPHGEATSQWGVTPSRAGQSRSWQPDPQLSALLSGTRAAGGTVEGDQAYLVGEQGSEIFQPDSSQTITPRRSNPPTSGGTTHVTVNVQTSDANSFQRSQGQISAAVARMLQTARRYN